MKQLFTIFLLGICPTLYGQIEHKYIPDRNTKSNYQNTNLTSGFKYIKTGRKLKYVSTACLISGGAMVIDSRYTLNRNTRNTGIAILTAGAASYLIGESFEVEGFNRLHLGFFQLRIDIGKIKENQK
tara:strand:- start:2159 stop:2539 length:381 start_codon:yes stop_codon:yes gene_type:complete